MKFHICIDSRLVNIHTAYYFINENYPHISFTIQPGKFVQAESVNFPHVQSFFYKKSLTCLEVYASTQVKVMCTLNFVET